MPAVTSSMPSTASAPAASGQSASPSPAGRKTTGIPEKKYKCQFCSRAFSRSEHRSRHERSHTKERPFKCLKCRSTFVRRDLLLRHDRTVHAKDGGVPLHSEVRRRGHPKSSTESTRRPKPIIGLESATMEQIETSSDGMVDIETAAMLMTDFHHKAMANSQEPEPYPPPHLDGANVIVPHGPALLEPCAYPPSTSTPMPRATWDPYYMHNMDGSKPSSIASSIPGSQDSHASFNSSVSSVPPSLLPSIMERQKSLPSLAQAALPTGPVPRNLRAPNLLHGSIPPVDFRRPSPETLRFQQQQQQQVQSATKTPQIASEEECRRLFNNIKSHDGEIALLDAFQLPPLSVLNRYLSTYFNMFHHHMPFLHPASFKPAEAAAPLLLAVLSIGALYTFEQDHAFMLHIGSKVLVNQFLQNRENFSSRKCPLWTMQSTLLNMIFASWSGDPKGLEWACSIKSLLANMVAGNQYELKRRSEARGTTQPTHKEWIEDEECRRTYYAVYIFFGLLTLTFNHTPAIGFNEFDSLELPSSESLWNLDDVDSETWHQKLSNASISTFREAHDKLFQGERTRYSAFGARVMINALFLEVWYHKRSPEALQDVVTEYRLRLALETWEKCLPLCDPETLVVKLSSPHDSHPLIFNALAVYRNTRARLLVDLKSVQEALRYHDAYEVAAAMTNARDRVVRSEEMIKVIQECYDCIEVAARQGIRWVARTSATNWSIEHPLCGLDLMVILTLWLYRLEHDEEPATKDEIAMYNKLRNLFDDDSVDVYGAKLSSTVARLWGSMIDEVVVWGITRVMGEAFKLHSQALIGYEDDISSKGASPCPNISQNFQALEMQAAY